MLQLDILCSEDGWTEDVREEFQGGAGGGADEQEQQEVEQHLVIVWLARSFCDL